MRKSVCVTWSSTNTRFNPSSDLKVGPPTRESKHNYWKVKPLGIKGYLVSKGGGSPSINESFFFFFFTHFFFSFFFTFFLFFLVYIFPFSFPFSFSFSLAQSLVADTLKSMETEPEKHGYNKDGLAGDSQVAFSSWLDCKELRGKPWRCKKDGRWLRDSTSPKIC